ncbi:hypothetical protein LOTGIDRAFT_212836 [Lottia gigantea]|uniref:ABC transporter domain-containing protein n=1 Tax=Lottia gigantea TaxID=225164 RepID=V4ABB8_LOTGI|nr:hypothetical protein LOTGIDRAFT_212836 [Lottia gigantea]ESP01294.1 hypothetical protein LOTGIDRAFT_212836 [Lottia gigantea]
MGFGTQLRLLLWKNFMLRKRHPLRVIIELCWPLCLFLILVLVKTRPDLEENVPECHFDGKAMPSSGLLPFLQSYLCTYNNTCHMKVTEDETAGDVTGFNNSLLTRFVNDIETILSSNIDRNEIARALEDLSNLQKLLSMIRNGEIKLGNLLVDPDRLREQVANQSIDLSEESLDLLLNGSISLDKVNSFLLICNLTQLQAQELYDDFMAEYNSTYAFNEVSFLSYIIFQIMKLESLSYNIFQIMKLESLSYNIFQIMKLESLSYNIFQIMKLESLSYNIFQIMKLESLEFILNDYERIQNDFRNSNMTGGNGTRNLLESMGTLLCGRSQTFVNLNNADRLGGSNNFFGEIFNAYCVILAPFCQDVFVSIESNNLFSIVWRYLKPIVLGVIPYTPDTPRVQEIIRLANQTFLDISELINLADDWDRLLPQIYNYLNGPNIDFIRVRLMGDRFNLSGIPTLNRDFKICEYIGRFIYNGEDESGYDWRDSLNYTDIQLQTLKKYLQCFKFDKFIPYKDETSLTIDSVKLTSNNTLLAALVFNEIDDNTTHIKYKIRMNSDNVDSTKNIQDRYWRPGARASPTQDLKYVMFGFAFIQDMVDHAIIQVQTGEPSRIGVVLQQFPYPCYINDKFTRTISRTIPLFMVISWIYTVAMLVKGIVYEKEERLKEVMKIMGLSNGVHWLAWFINAFIMMFITVVILVLILKYGGILEYSDPTVILVFLLAFTFSTIMLCFFISTLFSKANLSAVCGAFIYFMLYLPYTFITRWEEIMTTSQKAALSLANCVPLGFGCSYISRYEEQAIGIQWSNIASSPMVDDGFNMQYCIGMMIIDGILYGILTWYIEAVFPGQFGIPKKFYFFIQKSYWFGAQYNVDSESPVEAMQLGSEPRDKSVGVGIRNLRKVYSTGKKVAVDGLSLNFYEDQITSFLGHNGAGKTTTMSILTGLFPPTEGTAYIYGKDIRTDMDDIRNSIGMCPQHNVLFDRLTVEEHIWFYASLKGCTKQQVQTEMPKIIEDVGLVNKTKEMSRNLSGGMKRKLSVAIAFVGGSKTVILDEPTAGVDPYARRAIWELLLKLRKGRTIILSTHHMDEADILGDRIAIISHGKLCCCGSSLFLKSKFGSGYYLTLVKQDGNGAVNVDDDDDEDGLKKALNDDDGLRPSTADVDEGFGESNGSTTGSLSVGRITGFVQKYVKNAQLVEDNSTELCYQLPTEAMSSGDFEALFTQLERSHHELGIDSFGLSDTSLEEVFLAVADETNVDDLTDEATRNNFRKKKKFNFLRNRRSRIEHTELVEDTDDNVSIASSTLENRVGFANSGVQKLHGWSLIFNQFLALFIKRFHHVRRSKKGFVCEIILPAGFVALAIAFSLILPPLVTEPPLELHPWLYVPKKSEPNLYMFYSNDNPRSTLANSLEQALLSKPWVGTRCMNPDVYSIDGYPCEGSSNSQYLKWTERPKMTGNLTIDSPSCDCSRGFPDCPKGAGGPTPSMSYLPTTDYLYNMTARNISDWLLAHIPSFSICFDMFIFHYRYAGISFGDINPLADVNSSQIVDIINRLSEAANGGQPIVNNSFLTDIDTLARGFLTRNVAKVWYNNKGWASSVSYMNVLNNMILRSKLPANKDPADYGITTINHPMAYNQKQFSAEAILTSVIDLIVAICVIFAMSFIPASFLIFLIEERVSDSKHMQFVSGINPTIYWISTFAWDMVNYLVPATLCVLIFLAFDQESYVSASNFPCLLALLFLYGWAIIPLMYPFSRLFSVSSSAFVTISCANVFLGVVSTLSTFIVELLEQSDKELADINTILKSVFLVLPHYCLGRGLIDMTRNQLQYDLTKQFFPDAKPSNILAWDLVGRNLFSLAMLGIFFFILNWLIEYRFFIKPRYVKESEDTNEDIDVSREKQRVLSGEADNDVLVLKNLSKVFYGARRKKLKAVDNLCVGVPRGQCFGLLGVNGAGKTTTFKMLTGDVPITGGAAHICQKSVLKEKNDVRQLMGYCPQFDALDSLLTGREHLEFYARVRGIDRSDVKQVADWAIRKLGLVQYADKSAGTYSGGNKRKLSTAISLIGNPQIIFLDEPTTGMDPKARRFLWNCITDIVKDGRSVILTSHSMEECEALCGRLVIMVNGKFKCIGSTQHLKNRFGDGYTLTIRISGQTPNMEPIKQYIMEHFSQAVLLEQHNNMVQYQLKTSSLSLAKLFSSLQSAKQEYHIEDYSVTQTTLDQVFINFAKKQTDIEETVDNELDIELREPRSNAMYDEYSLTGSTAELVRPDNFRSSIRSSDSRGSQMADVSVA